jgi:hypothetical protein
MLVLESPAVCDGIHAWKQWIEQLELIQGKFPYEQAVEDEMLRAIKVLLILEQYPQGLSADHPEFLKVVSEFKSL